MQPAGAVWWQHTREFGFDLANPMGVELQNSLASQAQPEILWTAVPQAVHAGVNRLGPGEGAHALAEREVHVWAARLDAPAEVLENFRSLLCPAEIERAGRFRFECHRNRFIAGRGLLRALLASYLGVGPGSLVFAYGPNGKPALAHAQEGRRLLFNMAHSEDLALFALTRLANVGVDVERVRVLDDADELVNRFFSPAEAQTFRDLPAAAKPAAFFNLWTRKEAWLKATGEGIAHSLHRVEVSFLSGDPARLIRLPADLGNQGDWFLQELAPATGFTGALAVSSREIRVSCRRWDTAAASGLREHPGVSI